MARVVLAMSGGVDSSVAAHLLQTAGHEVIGVFMRHGEESTAAACQVAPAALPVLQAGQETSHRQGCCSATDAIEARRVANRMDIPFFALDLQRDFNRVVSYFVDEYIHGRTPNPCVRCNDWIKFGRLFDYAESVDAEFVATGHYARMAENNGNDPQLLRGIDDSKDQSYALFGVERSRLSRMMLPVGGYHKSEIRSIASNLGLAVANKRDSQEICFVAAGKHADLVQAKRGTPARGRIVTVDGKVVGEHDGIERFTIGQRKGIGVALGEPHFVVRIDPATQDVVIGPADALKCRGFLADQINWLTEHPENVTECQVQVRYNSRSVPCTINAIGNDQLSITFTEPYAGVAPGQAAVLYDGPRVLGGGWIRDTFSVV
jgi:tRNA-uridine 2-sulfurtransferase